jgi:hypothetical protein
MQWISVDILKSRQSQAQDTPNGNKIDSIQAYRVSRYRKQTGEKKDDKGDFGPAGRVEPRGLLLLAYTIAMGGNQKERDKQGNTQGNGGK